MKPRTEDFADRFWSKVEVLDDDQCWNWTAALKENGYGVFHIHDDGKWRMRYAHRISWRLRFGKVPDGLYVCHTCDNRRCVNPNHLWLGTHQQNQADMGEKGRTYSPAKKLTDQHVLDIRRRLKIGESRIDLAAEYGVLPSHISRIRNGTRRAVR